jgi:hypothetical protein
MQTSLRSPTRLLLVALALGILADQLFGAGVLGVNAPLFVALGLLALGMLARAEGQPPTRANLWLAGTALLFSLFIVLREQSTLTFLNLCATAGCLLLLVVTFRAEPLHRLGGGETLMRTVVSSFEAAFGPAPLVAHSVAGLAARSDGARALIPVGRGLIIATPVVMVFGGLLVAADSVFAAYMTALLSLQLPFDMAEAMAHTLFAGVVAWACAGGMLVALRGMAPTTAELPAEGATQRLDPAALPWRPLGFAEALTVLVAVDALFGAFMLIQAAYLFGGLDTLDRTGMTYSEYARRGFFELLAVAVLALGLLWGLALLARRTAGTERRAFNTASAAMVALVLGLLASAFQRMLLYQAAYGFTHLRIYTLSFMVWLALVLLLFLVALLREQPRYFTFGTFVTALAYLAALNLANPDALIVRENVARYHTSGELDSYYLTKLSADAVPALVEAIPTLPAALRPQLEAELATQRERAESQWQQSGWPGWHAARARARGGSGAEGPREYFSSEGRSPSEPPRLYIWNSRSETLSYAFGVTPCPASMCSSEMRAPS